MLVEKKKKEIFASTLDKSCSLLSGKVVDNTVYMVSFWSSDCKDEHLLEVILGFLKTLFSFLFMATASCTLLTIKVPLFCHLFTTTFVSKLDC